MCGRMTLTRSGSEIADYFAQAIAGFAASNGEGLDLEAETPSAVRPRFNLAPSQPVLTIVPAAAGTGASAWPAYKRWGLVPSWAKDPGIASHTFNARSETVDTKPSFRAAFKRRRCLVAADGFYEWTPRNRGHEPFLFRASDSPLLALAGLFEEWSGEGGEIIESCTVLTTEANRDLEGVHHRMPVILSPQDQSRWLDPTADPALLKALLVSAPEGTLERTAVSRYVNDPRRDDPRCLEPKPLAEQADLFALEGDASDPALDEEF